MWTQSNAILPWVMIKHQVIIMIWMFLLPFSSWKMLPGVHIRDVWIQPPINKPPLFHSLVSPYTSPPLSLTLFIPVFIFGYLTRTSSLSSSFVFYLYFHPSTKSRASPLLPFSVLFSLSEIFFYCLLPSHKQHLIPMFLIFPSAW